MKSMPVLEIDIFTHEGFIAYVDGVEVSRFNLPAYFLLRLLLISIAVVSIIKLLVKLLLKQVFGSVFV